ncbi:hypothetical protein [Actinophytocola sp.]|uniref:hypothetical protein n=1 Tax=Actinophytocola sp. TaxID=1872138 RepID=UPI003D6B61D6
MATTLPVPIEFELPPGWVAAPPDELGAPGAAFVALHPDVRSSGFTANITIGGEYRMDPATLADIADESVETLAGAATAATLASRNEFGDPDAPGLTQLVRIRDEVGGIERALAQCQVYLSMSDVDDDRRRVVLRLALTATEDQIRDVIADFQRFVSSIRPE